MAYTFFELCPTCNTLIRIVEGGMHYPSKSHDPIYCPVCGEIACYKNTMYDFEEYVESTDNTIEPYKTKFLEKNKK